MIRMALTPIGKIDPAVLAAARGALESAFPVEVESGPYVELPPAAFAPERAQWSSPLVLESVLRSTPPGFARHLALTSEDLYIPMLTFVYGQAQLGGRAAVVSIARLRQEFYGLPPNQALLEGRTRKEAVHETGHLFGLVHCESESCAMRLSTNVRQLDLKSDSLCARCAARAWENPS